VSKIVCGSQVDSQLKRVMWLKFRR